MIKIGTSGYSYTDWKGTFYPKTIKSHEMLTYYARFFECVEINFTYYRLPQASQFVSMIEKSKGTVEFVVKAFQDLTHKRVENYQAILKNFLNNLKPLVEAELLGAILFQFPYSFKYSAENCRYLEILRELTQSQTMIIEFRHTGWIRDEVFDFLHRNELGFCCVDEPQLPGLMPVRAELTSKIGYVRFHGRNAHKWWHHDQPYERYHYLYTADELAEWLTPINKLAHEAEKVFVFTNNHYLGNAATNAQMLKDLLGQKSKTPVPMHKQQSLNLFQNDHDSQGIEDQNRTD
ncbi:DUF72 domain-containing protein [candidate division CSSED10-310 bacterium]|uniref:DUF72 domain-containing protein n=1 Tax=candidate division CSSED10-310 bacterium TaxID=2855610 RepID=A0ABV6YVB3_UNCC1